MELLLALNPSNQMTYWFFVQSNSIGEQLENHFKLWMNLKLDQDQTYIFLNVKDRIQDVVRNNLKQFPYK